MNRLDALTVREKDGKSYWLKIGVAFPSKDGSGFRVLLDAIPAPTDGQFQIMLRPPQDGGTGNRAQTRAPDDDGPIPF